CRHLALQVLVQLPSDVLQRPLHSLPTRRSSDLGDQGATGATGERGIIGPRGAEGDPGATGATGEQGFAGDVGPKGDTGAVGATGDRKSTRLNSSHVKSSYAVFCLKHKTDRHLV